MPRQIFNIDGLVDPNRGGLPFTKNQIYKLTRHPEHPLPHKKCGKRLLFDLERVHKWFDSLPGKDATLEFGDDK